MLKTPRAGVLKAACRAQPLHLCHCRQETGIRKQLRPRAVRSVLDGKTVPVSQGLWSVWSLVSPVLGIWTLSSLSRMAVAAQLSPSFPHHLEASGQPRRPPPVRTLLASVRASPAPTPVLLQIWSISVPESQVHLLSAAQTKIKSSSKTALSPPVQLLVVTLSRSSEVHPSFSHVSLLLYPVCPQINHVIL